MVEPPSRRAAVPQPGSTTPRRPAAPGRRPERGARELLALARAGQKESFGPTPIIRGVEPSRAAWGEHVVVSGDFPTDVPLRVALRSGVRVFHLEPRRVKEGRVRVTLPQAPADEPSMVAAELFVVAARQPSRACRLALFSGPVLRRIRRGAKDEWVLEGTNFGSAIRKIKVEAAGAPKTRVLAASNTEIRVRARLADRAPVRVRVSDRVSNSLQARG